MKQSLHNFFAGLEKTIQQEMTQMPFFTLASLSAFLKNGVVRTLKLVFLGSLRMYPLLFRIGRKKESFNSRKVNPMISRMVFRETLLSSTRAQLRKQYFLQIVLVHGCSVYCCGVSLVRIGTSDSL